MNLDSALSSVIATEEFVQAWRYVTEQPCSFLEFCKLPMPSGVRPETLWNMFCIQRRHAGVTCAVKPWSKVDEDASWYYIPKSTNDDISSLMSLCSDGSFLGNYLMQDRLTDFTVLGDVFKEVSSLAWRDGLDISAALVGRIWLGAKEPSNDEEKVIKNLSRLFYDLKRFRSRRFSFTLIEDIHELLVEGVGELACARNRMLADDVYWEERLNDTDFAIEMAESVAALARSNKRFRSPVLVCMEITDVFWDLPVFPSLNALTEFLVRRLYLMQKGLLAMSYIPFSACRLETGGDYVESYEARYREEQTGARTVQGLDCSLLYVGGIKTYLAGARRLEERARKAEQKANELEMRLAKDKALNERQRKCIIMSASHPGHTIGIQDYVDVFDVVYSTARNDLLHLAEAGYLTCRKSNRELRYRLRPGALKN